MALHRRGAPFHTPHVGGQNMLTFFARLHASLLAREDRGQATTEYALVLLGAALVALLLVAWATSGGGAGKVGQLLNRVLDAVTSRVR
jgi:Flp pilus assembly pilin Flp